MDNKDTKGHSGNTDQDRNGPAEGSETPKGKLESLLAEWDRETQGTDGGKPDKGKATGTGGDEVAKRLERLETVLSRTSYESDMKGIVAEVKGELDVDDWIVESWINRKADSDPRLVKLWEERDQRKGQFQKAIESLVPEFQEYAKERILSKGKPEEETEVESEDKRDDKGLSAAVRSARSAQPSNDLDNVAWASLSSGDFALKRAEVFRALKAGKLK